MPGCISRLTGCNSGGSTARARAGQFGFLGPDKQYSTIFTIVSWARSFCVTAFHSVIGVPKWNRQMFSCPFCIPAETGQFVAQQR